MKKAILVEPKLLAKVERETPFIYNLFARSHFASHDYADYGNPELPMYMEHSILELFEIGHMQSTYEFPKLKLAFQAGWMRGIKILMEKYDLTSNDPVKSEEAYKGIIGTAFYYRPYDFDNLINQYSFSGLKKRTYSTLTYIDAQYITAWQIILNNHLDFDSFLTLENSKREKK